MIQYLLDEQGNKEFAVLPIHLWQEIQNKLNDILPQKNLKQNLVQILRESPLVGLDLDMSRDHTDNRNGFIE